MDLDIVVMDSGSDTEGSASTPSSNVNKKRGRERPSGPNKYLDSPGTFYRKGPKCQLRMRKRG